jgi:transketolase
VLASRIDKQGAEVAKSDKYFYCLMGDGELNEGQVWEAAMHAGKEKLGNLIGIIDRNHIQIDGNTDDVMPLEPLKSKWESFGWHTQEVDGHNFEELNSAIELARNMADKPSMIIAITVPGKGVREIEGDYKWHGKPPTQEEGEKFIKELKSVI